MYTFFNIAYNDMTRKKNSLPFHYSWQNKECMGIFDSRMWIKMRLEDTQSLYQYGHVGVNRFLKKQQ